MGPIALVLLVITSFTTTLLSDQILFNGQQWNWVGKSVSLIIALAVISNFRPLSQREFGLTRKFTLSEARPLLLICLVYFVLRIFLYIVSIDGYISFDIETVLFQATLPGLEEEVVFRGFLLTILNHVFVRSRWRLANVSFGWAAIITSVLFGLVHGISIESQFTSIHSLSSEPCSTGFFLPY